LDRPLFSDLPITWWHVALVGLAAFIVFTRLWDLSSRGYSHDESIHAWESWKLVTGQGYRHNPVYHGPLLYHYTALLFALFGHSDFVARLGTSLVGVAIALSPLLFRRWLGKWGVLAAVALIAISPVMMHRSRFIRHDHFAVLFNLGLFLGILRYLTYRQRRDLYMVAAMLVLSLAAKETTFITFFIFGTFLVGYWVYQRWCDASLSLRDMFGLPAFDLIIVIGTLIFPFAAPFAIQALGGDPVDYQTGVAWKALVLLATMVLSAAIGIVWDRRRWLVAAGIFWGIFLPLFTTLFTNPVRGFATGTVGQLGYWLSQHGVARGGQPWYYYLILMSMYELLPMLLGLGATVYYVARGQPGEGERPEALGPQAPRVPFMPLLIYWTVMGFAVYSWAGEKMPWLTMHLVAPLHLVAGWGVGRLLDAEWDAIRERRGLWVLLLGPLFIYLVLRVATSKPIPGTTVLAQTRWFSVLVILIGLCIVASALARLLGRLRSADAWRLASLSVIIVLVALTLRFAWMASFTNASYATEFLVYAHGTPDTVLVARELEEMSRRLTGGLHLRVAYDNKSSWPFEWYLRDFDRRIYYGSSPQAPLDAEVVLVGSENESAVRSLLGNRYYRREYRLIWWPNQEFYFDLTPARVLERLRDPVKRAEIWNILFYRQHPRSPDDWYLVSTFSMYVRRDVAQQLWDYGPEILGIGETLPGDEYIERWQEIDALAVWGTEVQLSAPKGLALDAAGRLYVADSGNDRIAVFGPEGQLITTFGQEGAEPGAFMEPWGVAVGPDGEVYVADTWNHRIQVFDGEGRYLRGWGVFGTTDASGPGTLLYGPRDVAVDAEGHVYVTDTGNKRVIRYDREGNVLRVVGGDGGEAGRFREPVGLALAPDGTLYVADTWNRRIQAFDGELNYLREWPIHAWEGASVVNKPYLSTDAEHRIYATDPEGYRVLVFDRAGELLWSWGRFGSDTAAMNLPTGVIVDAQGRAVVSDSGNNRLLVFPPLS